MKLVLTGSSSNIAKNLLQLILKHRPSIEIITIGRNDGDDIKCDMRSFSQIQSLSELLKNEINPDYFFLNHGILLGNQCSEMTETDVNDYMMVNLYSYLCLIEAILEIPKVNSVVMSSISGKEGSYDSLYAACKAGVSVLRPKLPALLDQSSRLNFISPGVVCDAV